jgi:hypothetical protein
MWIAGMKADQIIGRLLKVVLAALGLLLGGGAAAQAQQFSADLVNRHGDASEPAGRLIALDDKVRIETPELPEGFFVIDGAKPSAFFVRPAMRLFMDARQSNRLTRLFVPVDPDDPCRQWQVMARLAGVADQGEWRCERTGEETIGGHRVIAYRAISAARPQFVGWIDPLRRFPLQIETDNGVITAENIRDEPVAAHAFDIPSNFRKFDPESLLRQVKQSDAWVEP